MDLLLIFPVDHSRVKLLPADDDECSDYINANYMPVSTFISVIIIYEKGEVKNLVFEKYSEKWLGYIGHRKQKRWST